MTMVTYAKKDAVAFITLGPSANQNRIDDAVAARLRDIESRIRQDTEVRAVIIGAEGGDVFCAGTDIEALSSMENRAEGLNLFSVASVIDAFDCPVIAAVNGAAAGQGLEMALACDLRICASNATFTMPQAARGEIPFDGGTQRLSRLVGKAKALEMILLGEPIDADEALRIGLVHGVVAAEDLRPAVEKMARKIAGQSPISMAYAKEAIHKGMDMTLEQGLRLEADLYYLIHTTRDRVEGITAFRQKRRPQFNGE